jgi:predicted nucleotidyltransferase
MLTKENLEKILQEHHAHFAAKYGVKKLALFGSYALSIPNETSDVDLLVEFDRSIGLRFMDFADELESLLGRKVDLLTEAGLRKIRNREVSAQISQSLGYV